MLEIHEIEKAIRTEFKTLQWAREDFPMLTTWGVEDFSVTIHSLGCSYLSALGRRLGFWAMSEYPVRTEKCGPPLRHDAVWWAKPGAEVVLLGEFERFEPHGEGKLLQKAKNLMVSHHQLGAAPRILLLLAWSMAGTDMHGIEAVRAIGHNGFRTETGAIVRGLGRRCAFIVKGMIFGVAGGIHRLQGIY